MNENIERKVDMLISGMKIPQKKTRSRVATIATSLLIAIAIIASASLIDFYYVQTGTIGGVKSAITITDPDGTSHETPWTTEPDVTLGTIQAGVTYIYPETALQDDGETTDWVLLSYIDATDDVGAWDPNSDTIFIDDNTANGKFDTDETVLAGVTPYDQTPETGDGVQDSDWTLIKTYDAADGGVWDDSADAIVLDCNNNNIYDGDDELLAGSDDELLAGSGYYTITNHADTDATVYFDIVVTETGEGDGEGLLVEIWDVTDPLESLLLTTGQLFDLDPGGSVNFEIHVTAHPLIDVSSTYGYIITLKPNGG